MAEELNGEWADETLVLMILMRLEAKLHRLVELLEDEFGEEEEEPDA